MSNPGLGGPNLVWVASNKLCVILVYSETLLSGTDARNYMFCLRHVLARVCTICVMCTYVCQDPVPIPSVNAKPSPLNLVISIGVL